MTAIGQVPAKIRKPLASSRSEIIQTVVLKIEVELQKISYRSAEKLVDKLGAYGKINYGIGPNRALASRRGTGLENRTRRFSVLGFSCA